ncbi:phosphoribosylanthranilate isomerase [Paucidesulfovibrio longus]|uniref:phosphoribosylanthranilate isomerase n=1 Tax=Paucidesulfovibrio longus TaxID=889 RepID=UPI0003FCA5B4|nr:phosphoribosylanthranilate isomerase [Paucidesulfovibrio longus]
MLALAGFTHLGFPLGPGVVEEDVDAGEALRIVRSLAAAPDTADVCCVLITYLRKAEDVLELLRRSGMRAVQLHAPVDPASVAELRRADPSLLIFKSIVMGRTEDADPLTLARAHAPFVDAFLTDTYDPATGNSGATGRTHDWSLSRALVRAGLRPVILAGGLTPGNVAEAVQRVRPAGVDAHTGLEDANGAKDPEKARCFVRNALRVLPNVPEKGKQFPPFCR